MRKNDLFEPTTREEWAYVISKNYEVGQTDDTIEKGVSFDDLNALLDDVEKANDLTATDVIASPNNILVRQNLEAYLMKLDIRDTPLSNSMKRVPGKGSAVAFNTRKALGKWQQDPREWFYPDNGLPDQQKPEFAQLSFAYSRAGDLGGISNYTIAAGESYGDLYQEELDATIQLFKHREEWNLFHGNSTYTNSQGEHPFNGLDNLIVSNVIDAQNQVLTADMLERAIQRVRARGATPSGDYAFFVSFGNERQLGKLAQSAGDIRLNITTNEIGMMPLGGQIGFYQSTGLGKIDVVGDFFINPQGVEDDLFPYGAYSNGSPLPNTGSGNGTSTVYLVPRKWFVMSELKSMGRTPLAIVKDGVEFFVNAYETPMLWAEPWCAVITNVQEPVY